MADCVERVWVVAGPKYESEAENNILVRKSLYGLKISSAAFRDFLAENMYAMVYKPRYADPDIWLRPAVKSYGFGYYKYILCYVNHGICILHNPRKSMKRIQEYFKLKDDRIEPPDVYLVESLSNMKLESGKYFWTMFTKKYVKAAITNME